MLCLIVECISQNIFPNKLSSVPRWMHTLFLWPNELAIVLLLCASMHMQDLVDSINMEVNPGAGLGTSDLSFRNDEV